MPSDELAEAKAMLEKVTKAWHERLDQVQDLKEMVRDAQVAKADAMAHAEQCQASMAAALDKAMGEMRSRVAAEKRAAEAESARDAWAHQCNLASEAYAALLARPASVDAAVQAETRRVLDAFRAHLDALRAIPHAAVDAGAVRNAIEQAEHFLRSRPQQEPCRDCGGTRLTPMSSRPCETCSSPTLTLRSRPQPAATEPKGGGK